MGKLDDYSLDQVAGATALVLGSLGGLLLICFKSRCSSISLCWGIWKCDRNVPSDSSEEDVVADVEEAIVPPDEVPPVPLIAP
tara:strand:+ start:1919 stop:2167 length:249 start_codon:yes stop_codon:yes gene_type:complete